MKTLFIGEIVGKAGVYAVKTQLKKLKEEYEIDCVIANGNGTTGGFGMGKNHALYLRKLGIDVFTSGECVYYKKDMVPMISRSSFLLRPANYPAGNPGRGWTIVDLGEKGQVGVINMMGLSGFDRTHLNNPFSYVPEIIKKIKETTPHIFFNFHAMTSAEKRTMAFHLDGKLTAVLGSGFKVLTSDGKISDKGTFSITDTGRTGSFTSVGGLDPSIEIDQFVHQIPQRSRDYMENIELQGILIESDEEGNTVNFEIIKRTCPPVENKDESDG